MGNRVCQGLGAEIWVSSNEEAAPGVRSLRDDTAEPEHYGLFIGLQE
jgi:hypothetical protein